MANQSGRRIVAVGTLALVAAACGRGPGARTAEMGSFRAALVGASVDPTLRPARLLPETVDESSSFGNEAGGGSRVLSSGLRIVTSPKGAIAAAEDRLPQTPQATVALPERLGGGFLFVLGTVLWRADRWLGPAKPIFNSPQAVQSLVAGLDRVYVRTANGVLAIDGRTGQALDLGPWPASPYVASYAAADGWRAAAVTDLRGVVATFDAGATWRTVELALDPKQVVVASDSLAIGGFDTARAETWYELRADGSLARLGAPPREAKTRLTPSPPTTPRISFGSGTPPVVPTTFPAPAPTPSAAPRPRPTAAPPEPRPAGESSDDFAVKTFGKRPLATAIEDGWPLTDGTAVVARDGSLARVRLADGALTEVVRDAFPLKPARCHPLSLTRPTAAGAFGFVCGEPRGTTVIYAYEPLRGRLAEIKRFDKPRVVTSSGNGALAVRGACAEDAEPPAPPAPEPFKLKESDDSAKKDQEKDKDRAKDRGDKSKTPTGKPAGSSKSEDKEAKEKDRPRPPAAETHPYCVLGHDNVWREIHVRGDLGGERVVVLADGRIVVVSPPLGLGAPARLTILDKGKASTVPVVYPKVTPDVARVLRLGLWLDGFEERKPGVVGGWIEAGGAILGVEIGLDGQAITGQFIRDAGTPFVSGRYGLGWSASHRGFETTDGGMTWAPVDLPDPLVPQAKVERRACGPIGCLAHGWLRIGWGEAKRAPPPATPAVWRGTASASTPNIQLSCEPLAGAPPVAPPSRPRPATAAPAPAAPRPRLSLGGPPVLGSFNGLSDLPPFYGQAAPLLRESDRGINVEVKELVERYPNVGALARVYGWGPKTGDWDTLGRWQVRWLSPFAGWPEIRSSLAAPPPQMILDMTRFSSGFGYHGYPSSRSEFQLSPGDDPAHALLVGKRLVRSEGVLFELEADRAPVEVRRADGEPFGEIEGVVRAAGRWFVATPPAGGSTTLSTVIWQIEGAVARELVRVPRAVSESAKDNNARTKLGRRSDGRAIGLVVEGQAAVDRTSNLRWVLPIDLESGATSEPEALGSVDLAGRTLDGCTDDVIGWVVDTAIPSTSVRIKVPQGSGSLNGVQARLRLTSARACIERLAGTYDGQSSERAAQLTRPGPPRPGVRTVPPEVLVTAMSNQTRYPLRCSIAR